MIKLSQAVIVEGKYDKIRLSNILDAVIITTDGFGIFKNEEKRQLIRLFAESCGIVVITDSDNAGQMIRKHLQSIASGGKITNVYLPAIVGKEPRKVRASAAGLLGVEGTDDQIIIEALNKAGLCFSENPEKRRPVTKTDLFTLGLSGTDHSRERRRRLCQYLDLPELPANSLIDALNTLYGYDKFMEMIKEWNPEETEN